jgi:hypothetical protein
MASIVQLPRKVTPSAFYLISHGPYRQPRVIELQYFRILRYRRALESRINREFQGGRAFVDLNYPRVEVLESIEHELPNLWRLLEAVRERRYEAVFMDLRVDEDFRPRRYAFIKELLERAGAEVFNAYYDDGGAIAGLLEKRYGPEGRHAVPQGHEDDFVAFFPALAGEVALEALKEEWYDEPSSGSSWFESSVARRLRNLREENPYNSSSLPLLSNHASRRLNREVNEREERERAERRLSEPLLRLNPDRPGVLFDEGVWGGARPPEALGAAEDRLTAVFGFTKTVEGQLVTYLKEIDGYRVYGDPRKARVLTFHVYPPAVTATEPIPRRRRQSPREIPSLGSFELQDRLKNNLPQKFEEQFQEVLARNAARPRRART